MSDETPVPAAADPEATAPEAGGAAELSAAGSGGSDDDAIANAGAGLDDEEPSVVLDDLGDVSFADAVQRRFTRASPFMLLTGVSLGIQFSSQLYGAVALGMFAGQDALKDFIFRPDGRFDGRWPRWLKIGRLGNATILMNIAPALLMGQLLPNFSSRLSVSTAFLVGSTPRLTMRCKR